MNGITKETFAGYDTDSKLNTLFDYIHNIYEKQEWHYKAISDLKGCAESADTAAKDHEKRIKDLEKRKKTDSAVSSSLGFTGGFIAAWAQKFFLHV